MTLKESAKEIFNPPPWPIVLLELAMLIGFLWTVMS